MTETSSLLVKVIDNHGRSAGFHPAPPLVAVLVISVGALDAGGGRLTTAWWAPEPPGVGFLKVEGFLVHRGPEGLDIVLHFQIIRYGNISIKDRLLGALVKQELVLGLNVPGDVAPGLGHANDYGVRARNPSVCLLAVLKGSHGIRTLGEVALAEPLLDY